VRKNMIAKCFLGSWPGRGNCNQKTFGRQQPGRINDSRKIARRHGASVWELYGPFWRRKFQ
jgi:hypothetical protein